MSLIRGKKATHGAMKPHDSTFYLTITLKRCTQVQNCFFLSLHWRHKACRETTAVLCPHDYGVNIHNNQSSSSFRFQFLCIRSILHQFIYFCLHLFSFTFSLLFHSLYLFFYAEPHPLLSPPCFLWPRLFGVLIPSLLHFLSFSQSPPSSLS